MSDTPFATPAAPGSGISWADYNGRLLLIEPHAVKTDIQTSFGPSDAVQADVVVLDGDDAGTEYPDTLIFPKVLQSQVAGRIGQKVLGRLGQGQAKPGQSAPWMLAEATADDIALGQRWLNHKATQVAAPAPAQDNAAKPVPF